MEYLLPLTLTSFLIRLAFLRSGVNSCIFAYGQTGSGKTYSMMGDIPQLGTDKLAANDGLSSSSNTHPQNTGNHEGVEADETERFPEGNGSSKGRLGIKVGGISAGVIPRAVDDIFRIVNQGGVRGETTTTPPPSSSGRYSFREPPEEPQPPPAEEAPSPRTVCVTGFVPTPNKSAPGTSHSSRSSGSTSSEDSSLTQVPSAAHWPLSEPIVYVPRAQIPRDVPFSPARRRVQPSDDSKKRDAPVETEESDGNDEKLNVCQERRGETTTTCKYSVQCSYLQVSSSPLRAIKQEGT